jgi:hypothetical protein
MSEIINLVLQPELFLGACDGSLEVAVFSRLRVIDRLVLVHIDLLIAHVHLLIITQW